MRYILMAIVWMCAACTQNNNSQNSTTLTDSVPPKSDVQTFYTLDERLPEADSIVFQFYKDPYGKDSLRYTRFYTQYATANAEDVAFVKLGLQDSTSIYERVKNCRSEGKMYFYKDHTIFQTIYFANKSPDCAFLYLIKDGWFYYSPISKELVSKLAAFKQQGKPAK